MRDAGHRRQRNWGARILEYDYKGMRVIFLENEKLRVGVLTDKGSDVIEFNHKPSDTDFAWLAPGGVTNPNSYLSTSPDAAATFLDSYPGGWQEIFPNGGAPSTYLGATFGQHGEVANLPWDYEIIEDDETAVAVRLRVRTKKVPFLLEKTLRMESGGSNLWIEETLTNESEVSLSTMWGHHIAFGNPFLEAGCRVRLPEGATVIPHGEAIQPDGRRVSVEKTYDWPLAENPLGEEVDLGLIPVRGTASEMLYITDLSEGWYEIENPYRELGLRVEWDIEQMPYLWFWQEFGATESYPWYGRTYNVGLEPFSSYPTNGLAEAVENGTAMSIHAREKRRFSMRARVFDTKQRPPSEGVVKHVE